MNFLIEHKINKIIYIINLANVAQEMALQTRFLERNAYCRLQKIGNNLENLNF